MGPILLVLIILTLLFVVTVCMERYNERQLLKELTNKQQKLHPDAIALKLTSAHLPRGGSQAFELVIHEDKLEMCWKITGHLQQEFPIPEGHIETQSNVVRRMYEELKELEFSKIESECKPVKDGWRVQLTYIENQIVRKLKFVSPENNREAVIKLLDILEELSKTGNTHGTFANALPSAEEQ